jgi:glutamate/tyrosine decarboxylase-like PLP-dependent enzyme
VEEMAEPKGRSGLEMDPEEMRRLGYAVVDQVVSRWVELGADRPWEGGTRRELEPRMAEPAPEEPRDPHGVMERALADILPKAGRIDHPRFFAFIPSSPTWASILGEYLATGFNIFQGTWLESAGPSQLELVVTGWFRDWLGLPDTGGGLLTSGGSAANLIALVTARERAGNPPDPTLYLSDQGHSSLERAARILNIPEGSVRRIPTDETFRMDLLALRESIEADRVAGRNPLCVCGNAGATNTGAIDPLSSLAALAREEGIWFHVDGAYGGFAVLAPKEREAFRGMEEADSITLDPHKWLFQPYESGCLMVRDTRVLEDAFRILPEYLQDIALGEEQVNFADRGVQLTRRFRALGVWMSIQTFGLRAFRESIQESIDLARKAETFIRSSQFLEMLGPSSLGIVCFRYNPPGVEMSPAALEVLNLSIQNAIVQSGLAMMSSTRLRGVFSLRLAILNYRSTWDDVLAALGAIEEAGSRLSRGRST